MRIALFIVILVDLVIPSRVLAEDKKMSASPDDKNQIIFKQPIGQTGEHLTVIRGPNRDPSLFSFWKNPAGDDSMPSGPDKQMINLYEVRVELRSPNAETLMLAARLRVEGGMPQNKGIVVLDALVEPGNVVLITAEGPFLALWQINVGGKSTWTPLITNKGWSAVALLSQLNEHTVGASLSRMDDGRLSLHVTDKRADQNTFYEEGEKGSLQFKFVRQPK